MVKKKISLIEFESNPNIGLYMFANDKFCILGENVSQEKKKQIEEILNVPVYIHSILGTSLAGVFLAGNNDFLLIPEIYKKEEEFLKEICEKHEVKLVKIKSKINTFGNNIVFGKDNIVINSEFNKSFNEKLFELTKLKIDIISKKEFSSAGALCKFLNGKFFVSQELEEEDVKSFADRVAGIGTINSGNLFISSGIVGNSNGVLIGSLSTTIEIQNIVESLGYI